METTTDRPLTARQRDVLRAIFDHFDATGMPPTYAWLMRAVGVNSPNAVQQHVAALVRRGLVVGPTGRRRGGGARTGSPHCLRLPGLAVRVEYAPGEAGRRLREALDGEGET